MSKIQERVKVKSFEHLFEILKENQGYNDFFIAMNYGMKSSKQMQLFPDAPDRRFKTGKADKIDILHLNSGAWHTVTFNQLKNPRYSNIAKAIEKGAFYWEGAS